MYVPAGIDLDVKSDKVKANR